MKLNDPKLSRTDRLSVSVASEKAWQRFEPTQSNPWNIRRAAHLLRRAGFGGSIREIDDAVEQGLETALNGLFDMSRASQFESEMEIAGRMVGRGSDSKPLAAWWLLRMAQTPVPLLEKMTLFWHGHFATGGEKVRDGKSMLDQNKLLRQNALGHFSQLVEGISSDVAMLVYLDSVDNRKTHPNENYARELMELFCLGPGNYTEHDIKEIARCFTGWEVRRKKFRFNKHQHDNETKNFLNVSGNLDGHDAIRTVIAQPACSQFIAKKLIRFFVFDEPDVSDDLAEPIARQLRETDFDIAAVLRTILSSRIFYSDQSIGHKIKSPVELAIGTLRFFEATTNMRLLSTQLSEIGQLPLYPPNVKGWDGGRTWINASTILARANLVGGFFSENRIKLKAQNLSNWANNNRSAGVGTSVDWVNQYLLAVPLPKQTRGLSWQFNNQRESEKALITIAALPEFQLS